MVMINVGDAEEAFRHIRVLHDNVAFGKVPGGTKEIYLLLDSMLEQLKPPLRAATPELKPMHVTVYGHESAQVEYSVFPDYRVTFRHRSRANMTDPWGEWQEGKEE